MMSHLRKFHPLSQFIFIASVLTVILVINDPVILSISLIVSLLYTVALGGAKAFRRYIIMTVICMAGIMIFNPLVSHRGITVIMYLPDGNPLTLESVIYGAAAAMLISSTINWFYTVSKMLDSERIVYLFGRISPRLALLLSLTLGFVPKLRKRLSDIRSARKVTGRDFTDGGPLKRIKNAAAILSSLIGGALENSVDTADSMTSRGYGARRRSCFSPFRLFVQDICFMIIQLFCMTVIMLCYYSGYMDFSYYPTFSASDMSSVSLAVYLLYSFMCLFPLMICIKENIKWKYIRSVI